VVSESNLRRVDSHLGKRGLLSNFEFDQRSQRTKRKMVKMISEDEEKLLRETDVEPVKVFLLAALRAKSKGDSYNYSHIVHQIRARDDQEMVASVFIGLSSCVSQFTQR
jgi:hypothetical protein